MATPPEPDAASTALLRQRLLDWVTRQTGFAPGALRPEVIDRALVAWPGLRAQALAARLDRDDPALLEALLPAVLVPETYFFRGPEQFQYLARHLAPRWAAGRGGPVRALSAGCATGEEAHSLAALLLAEVAPAGRAVEVLGVDLSEAHLEVARRGQYHRWSLREAGPLLYPVVQRLGEGEARVLEPVARACRFLAHNLLLPLPEAEGPFDLICCRNVLPYLTVAAAQAVIGHLAARLHPGGVLAFAPLDVLAAPVGLVGVGPPQLQLYQRPLATIAPWAARPVPAEPVARPELPPAVPVAARREGPPPPGPEALHLEALALLDGGRRDAARRVLETLVRLEPGYVPGRLGLAVVARGDGDGASARGHAREALQQLVARPRGEPLLGPGGETAEYYRTLAEALLSGAQGGS